MPIRLQCSCGKALAVKDEYAGKTVKCPGCQKGIVVPAAVRANQNVPAAAPAVVGRATAAATGGGLGDLFDEEGIAAQTGPSCPACGKPLKHQGVVICTNCGVNLQTGQRMVGANQKKATESSLGHHQLDEAVRSMKADAELQERTGNAGLPWWFLLLMLTFLATFSFIMVTIVNALNADQETTGLARTFKDWAANDAIVIGLIITGVSIQSIARIWITVLSFMEGVGNGIMTMLLYYKFVGQLFEYPLIALIYTVGFFTTLTGISLLGVDQLT